MNTPHTPDRPVFLTKVQVRTHYHVSNATLYRWMRDLAFPKPVKVGPAKRLWLAKELDAYEQNLVSQRDQGRRS
jgi:predicted DNA-binding transcriptional regulator AlpA